MSLSFNIFNGTTSDDIRVGYIDPEFGYVTGVSKCEANEYAFNNPGTTFILETREKIRYLNINEVNALTPNDLPSSLDTCTGIQVEAEPDPPSVGFFGGGGVGAIANPVFGLDGSLMAVDVVRGGHGYQYPPVVKVTDETGIGAGAVTRAILVGDPDYPECEFVETEEVFDQEDDFEDYQLCEDPGDDYGERYDTDGKSLGKWNPNAYASFDQDPIEREIQRYQEFLRELDNPWWTSRKEAPIRITSDTRPTTRVKYDVVHPAWGQGPEFAEFDPVDNTKYLRAPIPEDTFMNRYAISPVPPSNALGSDFDADTFNIFWEENFPFPGNYRFEAQGDAAIMNVYVDGTLLGRASFFEQKNKPAVFKKQLSEGVHEIRVELKNGGVEVAVPSTPQTEEQKPGTLFVEEGGQYYMLAGGNDLIEVDFDFNWDDDSRDSGYLKKVTLQTENGPLVFERAERDRKGSVGKKGTFKTGKKYLVSFEGNSKDAGFRIVNTGPGPDQRQQRIEFDDNASNGFDVNAQFTALTARNLSEARVISNASAGQSAGQLTEILDQPWNANPMGIALAIVAPLPPIPVKELPPQNDCPSIPFWTTRFPTNNLWWPVTLDDRWSQFMNKYAISPVPPLATESSDQGGVVFSTSWDIDAPYDGYYGIKGAVDNGGRILVDGSEVMSGGLGYRNSGLAGFRNNNPQTAKVFLSEGRHTITTEVINQDTTIYEQIDKKIFSTADWLVPPPKGEERKPGTLFVNEGGQYYMLAGGNDLIEVDFDFNWKDDARDSGYLRQVSIQTENGPLVFKREARDRKGSVGKTGTFKADKKYRVSFEGNAADAGFRIVNTGPGPDQRQQRIEFDDNASNGFDVNAQFTALTARNLSEAQVTPSSGTKTIGGVTYSGPDITSYINDSTDYLGPLLTPVYGDDYESTHRNKKWTMTWSNVNFPETGQYKLEVLADDILIVRVDGVDVGQAETFKGVNTTFFNVPAGNRTVELELVNADLPGDFSVNPTYAFARITKRITIDSGKSKPWVQNPVGISAIMIPPPCPKKEKGKGVICRVLVDDPGNGFAPPQGQGYPVGLELQSVEVETPGINYRCGEDQIIIEPSNGAELTYECDTFGRITKVNVVNPGFGFTRTPTITMSGPTGTGPSETGVNATFRPQFRIVRDPIVIDPDTIIQVTDLAGLKQTGYVDGRAYYGAVFYQEGVRYAGYYQTPGQLVQVYDTLQESIDAQVVTPPSAIIRQGTDIRSNDPRLNIPGTPDEIN